MRRKKTYYLLPANYTYLTDIQKKIDVKRHADNINFDKPLSNETPFNPFRRE